MRPPMPVDRARDLADSALLGALEEHVLVEVREPRFAARSSAEPTFAQICNSATAARCDSRQQQTEAVRSTS